MVSEYLNHTRSLEELDALFERDRKLAAVAVSKLFQHEISVAVSNISEIHRVAQARVLADSQVASAAIMSAAEVKAAHLLADAQKAKLKSLMRDYDTGHLDKDSPDEIDFIRTKVTTNLSKTASDAIAEIESAAEESIKSLKETASDAINQIEALAKDVENAVKNNARLANEKIEMAKSKPRTPEEATENAKEAAAMIVDSAKEASASLQQLTHESIQSLHGITSQAVETIKMSADNARKRLNSMLSTALKILAVDM